MPSQRMSESVQPLKDRIDELKRIQDDLRIKEFAIASSINGIAIGINNLSKIPLFASKNYKAFIVFFTFSFTFS